MSILLKNCEQSATADAASLNNHSIQWPLGSFGSGSSPVIEKKGTTEPAGERARHCNPIITAPARLPAEKAPWQALPGIVNADMIVASLSRRFPPIVYFLMLSPFFYLSPSIYASVLKRH